MNLHQKIEKLDYNFSNQRYHHLDPKIQDHIKQKKHIEAHKVTGFLEHVASSAPFLRHLINQDSTCLVTLLESNPHRSFKDCLERLTQQMAQCETEKQAMKYLRKARQEVALTLALADLSGFMKMGEITKALSSFAECAIETSLLWLLKMQHNKKAYIPYNNQNLLEHSGLIVLAMGKLGAKELNYSSDVDLILFYDRTKAKLKESLSHSSFFIKVARALVKLLQEPTEDGFVLRVDLRLRPDPGATSIVISQEAAFEYYQSMALNWERAAMIKARPIACDNHAAQAFLKELEPFIWRKYLDYGALNDIHIMKQRIYDHKGHESIKVLGHNVKLGRGGIRDIEFFVQTQQLIAGGRMPALRVRGTLEALKILEENGWIEKKEQQILSDNYIFLRSVEHRLQMVRDEQTHILPNSLEALSAITNLCFEENNESFIVKMKQVLTEVEYYYQGLFERFETQIKKLPKSVDISFIGPEADLKTLDNLKKLGFQDTEKAENIVRGWMIGRYKALRSKSMRDILSKALPLLLEALGQTSSPDKALNRFDMCLRDLPAGSQFFLMLDAHPDLMQLLAHIMGTAPHMANALTKRPKMLGDITHPIIFVVDYNKTHWQEDLYDYLDKASCFEDMLDRIRIAGQGQKFIFGVRLLKGLENTQTIARHFTKCADIFLAYSLRFIEKEMIQKYGCLEKAHMCLLAMGKLGSKEMTATSDIDMILIYDVQDSQALSDGEIKISAHQYYTKITKKLIAALSVPTAEGILYEVDMRLRPSGNSGPLATSLSSFETYQATQAWTWEHMALTRARTIGSDVKFQNKVNYSLKKILQTPRKKDEILKDIHDMRMRLIKEKPALNDMDVKLCKGGLTDIEFCVQAMQLLHACCHHQNETQTLSALKSLKKHSLISEEHYELLQEALLFYQAILQIKRLCLIKPTSFKELPKDFKKLLLKTVSLETEAAFLETMNLHQKNIKSIYAFIFGKTL